MRWADAGATLPDKEIGRSLAPLTTPKPALGEQWSSDMPKSKKSKNETAAPPADTSQKAKEPKELAEEWGRKIKQDKTTLEQRKKALAQIIIPYFNEVHRQIASEDFSFGVSELQDQKPVRVQFRLGDGRIAEVSVTSEGIILKRSDQPKEQVVKIGVEDPAETIENITKLITAFIERKA